MLSAVRHAAGKPTVCSTLLLLQLWEVCRDAEGNPQVRYVSSLSAHTRSVNCVRFSHSGEAVPL